MKKKKKKKKKKKRHVRFTSLLEINIYFLNVEKLVKQRTTKRTQQKKRTS